MTALVKLTQNMAQRFELDSSNAGDLMATLKNTAFKGQVSDAQMTALMLVAQQYGLNPWTREIYAFPDQQNGIVPVVGVDGWARIINENPQFDGMDFQQDEDSCTCIIYRKDRNHPIKVTEWMSECKRNARPWQSHPKRMLRHKALIQCARLAFGFVGIYDQDEADGIIEINGSTGEVTRRDSTAEDKAQIGAVIDQAPIPIYLDEDFATNKAQWRKSIISGKKTPAQIIAFLSKKATLTEAQKLEIDSYAHEND